MICYYQSLKHKVSQRKCQLIIFVNNLVLFLQYIILGKYNDDSNISISGSNKENLKDLLFLDFKTLNEWSHNNYLIVSPENCSCVCLGKDNIDDDLVSSI